MYSPKLLYLQLIDKNLSPVNEKIMVVQENESCSLSRRGSLGEMGQFDSKLVNCSSA